MAIAAIRVITAVWPVCQKGDIIWQVKIETAAAAAAAVAAVVVTAAAAV